ncbi:hypothetical protein [Malonomonas rubra]|uniref:hypothetical protein n=1 Tax=Malonomonas rubra TaxID=57040 RepID=UPI0026ED298A|nr:hypothetical protein [Malonomonas rubra]
MRIQSRSTVILGIILILLLLSGCSSGQYQPVERISAIKIEFVAPRWNDTLVPDGQQCKKSGGHGSPPELLISNIPSKANASLWNTLTRIHGRWTTAVTASWTIG